MKKVSMMEEFERFELLVKEEGINKLLSSHVCVFGVGGVGGYVCEALARAGVGHITIVDKDTVSISNINRQIIALHSTVGSYKCDVMEGRLKDINPSIIVDKRICFYLPENANTFDFSKYDYIVDCVDTVTAKLSIIVEANKCKKPVISAMGAGNKLDPTRIKIADIYKTSVDPLARVMRYELKKRGIKHLCVAYSDEIPFKTGVIDPESNKSVPGSAPFVPSAMGLIMASKIINDLLKD